MRGDDDPAEEQRAAARAADTARLLREGPNDADIEAALRGLGRVRLAFQQDEVRNQTWQRTDARFFAVSDAEAGLGPFASSSRSRSIFSLRYWLAPDTSWRTGSQSVSYQIMMERPRRATYAPTVAVGYTGGEAGDLWMPVTGGALPMVFYSVGQRALIPVRLVGQDDPDRGTR